MNLSPALRAELCAGRLDCASERPAWSNMSKKLSIREYMSCVTNCQVKT